MNLMLGLNPRKWLERFRILIIEFEKSVRQKSYRFLFTIKPHNSLTKNDNITMNSKSTIIKKLLLLLTFISLTSFAQDKENHAFRFTQLFSNHLVFLFLFVTDGQMLPLMLIYLTKKRLLSSPFRTDSWEGITVKKQYER